MTRPFLERMRPRQANERSRASKQTSITLYRGPAVVNSVVVAEQKKSFGGERVVSAATGKGWMPGLCSET